MAFLFACVNIHNRTFYMYTFVIFTERCAVVFVCIFVCNRYVELCICVFCGLGMWNYVFLCGKGGRSVGAGAREGRGFFFSCVFVGFFSGGVF